MRPRVHDDPAEFWSVTEKLFLSDPVRHSFAITVVQRLLVAPDPYDERPVMVTLWDGGRLVAAAVRTPPWPLMSSGIPADQAASVVDVLVREDPELPGVSGPRDTTEPFATAWSTRTRAAAREVMANRMYQLSALQTPTVAGQARLATEADIPLLARWRHEFEVEAIGEEKEPGRHESIVRRAMSMGSAQMLWEIDGLPVAWAAANLPVERMSRVGPVYTTPDLRGHGYGSAVAAAVSQWALDAGAEHVLLFTDLANPTSNAIYQRIGYRRVYDATEVAFVRPPTPTLTR